MVCCKAIRLTCIFSIFLWASAPSFGQTPQDAISDVNEYIHRVQESLETASAAISQHHAMGDSVSATVSTQPSTSNCDTPLGRLAVSSFLATTNNTAAANFVLCSFFVDDTGSIGWVDVAVTNWWGRELSVERFTIYSSGSSGLRGGGLAYELGSAATMSLRALTEIAIDLSSRPLTQRERSTSASQTVLPNEVSVASLSIGYSLNGRENACVLVDLFNETSYSGQYLFVGDEDVRDCHLAFDRRLYTPERYEVYGELARDLMLLFGARLTSGGELPTLSEAQMLSATRDYSSSEKVDLPSVDDSAEDFLDNTTSLIANTKLEISSLTDRYTRASFPNSNVFSSMNCRNSLARLSLQHLAWANELQDPENNALCAFEMAFQPTVYAGTSQARVAPQARIAASRVESLLVSIRSGAPHSLLYEIGNDLADELVSSMMPFANSYTRRALSENTFSGGLIELLYQTEFSYRPCLSVILKNDDLNSVRFIFSSSKDPIECVFHYSGDIFVNDFLVNLIDDNDIHRYMLAILGNMDKDIEELNSSWALRDEVPYISNMPMRLHGRYCQFADVNDEGRRIIRETFGSSAGVANVGLSVDPYSCTLTIFTGSGYESWNDACPYRIGADIYVFWGREACG